MNGLAPRVLRLTTALVLLCGLLTLAGTSGGALAGSSHPRALSAGRFEHPAASSPHAPAAAGKDLPYRGGPIMHEPTVYLLFWLPDGYHFHPADNANTDDNYEALQAQFIQDLSGSDFYDILTQYSDQNGAVTGNVNLGDAVVDTNPYPRNSGSLDNPLQESEIRREILNVANQQGWENQKGETEYIVYTAFDVQVCSAGNAAKNIKPLCTYRPGNKGACGWHNWFSSHGSRYLYSVIFDTTSFCHAWQRKITDDTAPNGDTLGDIAVDVTSHELFESVTDPFINAWAASSSQEIGDKCSDLIGPVADDGSDVVLNNDPYIVQEEWSNADHGCVI